MFAVVFGVSVSGMALASVGLTNEDSQEYRLLLADGDTCSRGTHTAIGGNTTASVNGSVKYICLNEQKPAFAIEDGKSYVIRDGVLKAR